MGVHLQDRVVGLRLFSSTGEECVITPADLDRATIFGQRAEDYARWRPTYPADAVDWVLPGHVSRVAEVGAGTGALTGSLIARGLQVDAVEPDERMLQVLARLHPGATPHLAAAEDLPLPDASVDAVLAAGAWHWFPFEPSVKEVRRILRPGGWLGLLWNAVAPLEPWEKELAALDPDYRPKIDSDENDDGPFPAEETETATFPWVWHTHARGLVLLPQHPVDLHTHGRGATYGAPPIGPRHT